MKKISLLLALNFVPFLVLAQQYKTEGLLNRAIDILQIIISIAILLAFLFFVWGIANFIRKADDSTGREEGKQQMVWGVVALAVLVSIWGIISWLQGEFGITAEGPGRILQLFGLGGNSSGGSGGYGTTGGSGSGCVINTVTGQCQ